MKFDDFDKKMRQYEQAMDQVIVPGMYIIVRLDGNRFSKLTYNEGFEKPFDVRFRDLMIKATQECMKQGFRITYGYTQSDEISLLFNIEDNAYNRKVRKILSLLAGAASARFSLELNKLFGKDEAVVLDSRVIALPNVQLVKDYFIWRQEDANRNALNDWCYWTLRKEGKSRGEATRILKRMPVSEKNELLFERGINYNNVPAWNKRGVGFYYEPVVITGEDPRTGEKRKTVRTKLVVNEELPYGDAYRKMVGDLIWQSELPREERFKRAIYDALSEEEKFLAGFRSGERIFESVLRTKYGDDYKKMADKFTQENKIREEIAYSCPNCEAYLTDFSAEDQNCICYNCDEAFSRDDAIRRTIYYKI